MQLIHFSFFFFFVVYCLKFYDSTFMCNNFFECSLLCALPSSPIPNASRLRSSSGRKVKEVNAWGGSVLQPLGSYFQVSNRRVGPCSLLASGISVRMSELHRLHGIRKTLVYDSKGQEGCVTSVRKAAKWEKAMLDTLKLHIWYGSFLMWFSALLNF